MDNQPDHIEKDFEKIDHPTRFAVAFKSLADNSKSLQLYLRYETAITRQYDQALKQLLALRTKFPIPAEVPNEPNDERTTTNDEPRVSALPHEPKPPEKCVGLN